MAKLTIELVTPERHVLAEEDVDVVIAPGIEGELAVLPQHAPLVTELRPGAIVLRRGGEEEILAVSGGFLEVLGDTVTVLADTSERSEDINLERAQEARGKADQRLQEEQQKSLLGGAAKQSRDADQGQDHGHDYGDFDPDM